jgi:hypothetical protein
MDATGRWPLPWRLQPEEADPPEWYEVVDATGAAVPFISDFELDETNLIAAIDALLRVVNHYPALLAAARAFDASLSHWCDGPERDALRAMLEAAGREGE